ADRGSHLLTTHRDLEVDRLSRFVEAVDVLFEAEDPTRVGADPFEDAIAIEQSMIEDADLGVGLVNELDTDVDFWAHWRAPPAAIRDEGGVEPRVMFFGRPRRRPSPPRRFGRCLAFP